MRAHFGKQLSPHFLQCSLRPLEDSHALSQSQDARDLRNNAPYISDQVLSQPESARDELHKQLCAPELAVRLTKLSHILLALARPSKSSILILADAHSSLLGAQLEGAFSCQNTSLF
jgi:hypothetical protein